MGLFDKVKNFFYDEEVEEDEEVEIPEKKHYKEKRENVKEEISERELFKAERTFNFPMDVDDEIEYEKKVVKEEKVNNVVNEKNYKSKSYNTNEYNTYNNTYSSTKPYTKHYKQEEKTETKKFKPTPVISPIYGVLDKNYKKEDIAIDATREFNMPKKLDYDAVRKKAYGNMYSSEKESKDDTKGIFFNLDEEKNESFNDENNDVKIVYNDVTFDEDEEDFYKEEDNNEENKSEEDIILSETKEQDLFNLIDNMYNSEEDDEEDYE